MYFATQHPPIMLVSKRAGTELPRCTRNFLDARPNLILFATIGVSLKPHNLFTGSTSTSSHPGNASEHLEVEGVLHQPPHPLLPTPANREPAPQLLQLEQATACAETPEIATAQEQRIGQVAHRFRSVGHPCSPPPPGGALAPVACLPQVIATSRRAAQQPR